MKIFKKKFLMFFSLLLILNLGFCNLLVFKNSSSNVKKLTYIGNIFYDAHGKIYYERKYKVSTLLLNNGLLKR